MYMHIFLIILTQLFLINVHGQTRYNMDNAPSLKDLDEVKFFYLQAPFPYNTPGSIEKAAGSDFNKYGVTHAGLGVWDTASDDKLTIEFVSDNYTGSLLPQLSNGYLTWHNAGRVVITDSINVDQWLSSALIATSTGTSYQQLLTFLQTNRDSYNIFQPVAVMYVNDTKINSTQASTSSASTGVSMDSFNSFGKVLVKSLNSFVFVDALINQLSGYGCDLESFLQLYASSYDYFSADNSQPPVVAWGVGEKADAQVYEWYRQLEKCYQQVYDKSATPSGGAMYFLQTISVCYDKVAYVYRDRTSVYNITLKRNSSYYSTPMLNQFQYQLPNDDPGVAEGLGALEWVIIGVGVLAIFAGAAFFVMKLIGKQQRRRVSFEGERVAARAVENIDEEHEDRAYFHAKSFQNQDTVFSVLTKFRLENNEESGGSANLSRRNTAATGTERGTTGSTQEILATGAVPVNRSPMNSAHGYAAAPVTDAVGVRPRRETEDELL